MNINDIVSASRKIREASDDIQAAMSSPVIAHLADQIEEEVKIRFKDGLSVLKGNIDDQTLSDLIEAVMITFFAVVIEKSGDYSLLLSATDKNMMTIVTFVVVSTIGILVNDEVL